MRTTDERMDELKRRMGKEQQKKKVLRDRATVIGSFVICFSLLLGASLAMPSLNAYVGQVAYHYTGPAASIFYEGSALGYVLIAMLSFVLGVCFTMLCYLLKRKDRRGKGDSDD